jgi:hypothetical protein
MVTYTNTDPMTATKMFAASVRLHGLEQVGPAADTFALAERCVR